MKELTSREIEQINGGIWGLIVGAGVALCSYAFNKYKKNEPMTVAGAATAGGFGAVTGGLGGAAVGAAGGGVIANVAWRPGFVAINAAGQAIASER